MSEQQLPVPLPPHTHLSLPSPSHTHLSLTSPSHTHLSLPSPLHTPPSHGCRTGDIALLRVEAVVNPSNESLTDKNAISLRLFEAAGPELREECKTQIVSKCVGGGGGRGVQMFTQLNVYTMNTHCSLFNRGRFVMFTVHLTHRLQNWGS